MKTDNIIQHTEYKRDLSILVVCSSSDGLDYILKLLNSTNQNYYINTAKTVEKTVALIKETYWDTIIIDLSIPYSIGGKPDSKNGLDAIGLLIEEFKITTPIISLTENDALSDAVLDQGAYYFLKKPVKEKHLLSIVRNSTKFQMSGFDGLTGLLNRTTFEERLKSEFERIKRKNKKIDAKSKKLIYSKTPKSFLSLIFIDGDNFKEINDTYNHLVGDQVLKKIGTSFIDESLYKRLDSDEYVWKDLIRPYDIAARFGGDEFSIFLPETGHESAIAVANRIRDRFNKFDLSEILGEKNIISNINKITLSIGIATYPAPNNVDNYLDLISHADNAMFASKVNRKGEIYGYNSKGSVTRLA